MSQLITQTAKLVPYAKRPKQVPSFVTAYYYEPMADETAAVFGNFYVVMEVLAGGRQSEEVADLIIEAFGEHYYNQGDQAEPLRRFEHAVKAVNRELAEYVDQGNAAWIGKLSAVLAVQFQHELHVAHAGSAEAYVYRGKASARITSGPGKRPAVPSKTFGSIASGDLEDGDRLLFATPALIHQIPLQRLQAVVSGNSVTMAVTEMTQLLRETLPDRIAALVVAITTPEHAAMQLRVDEPSHIELGAPETPLEAAKYVAVPLAQATVAGTKRVHASAKTEWTRTQPKLQLVAFWIVGQLRSGLATRNRRRGAVAGLVMVLVLGGYSLWHASHNAHVAQLLQVFDTAKQSYQAGQSATNQPEVARKDYNLSLQKLSTITPAQIKQLDQALATSKRDATEPRTVADLRLKTSVALDSLDGLVRVSSQTVARLGSGKGTSVSTFEIVNGSAYVLNKTGQSLLNVVNITSKKVTPSHVSLEQIGDVVSTTISSDQSGMYILTSQPSIWFYRFADDSIVAQTIGTGAWEGGSSLASYMGNLYLLSGSTIYKHQRTFSGFSPKSTYATVTGISSGSVAVDSHIYVAGGTTIQQYLSGSVQASAVLPDSLQHVDSLKLSSDGNLLVVTDSSRGRVGLYDADKSLAARGQIALNGKDHINAASIDAASHTGYALTGNTLVSFPFK